MLVLARFAAQILDLSHVPFSHHGVAGAREEALPITMSQVCHSVGSYCWFIVVRRFTVGS